MSNRIRRPKLTVQALEARDVPASFGVPWSDPTHLTLSFVPDGTSAAGVPSELFTRLDALMPRAEWQGAILRAAQSWAEAANLNIGVVFDGGQPLGDPGATQGDPRFGDIRIGAVPMADDALGEAVPPDPILSGTLAGDVFFNSTVNFTPAMLYGVALHEVGHALGLAPNTNPVSVMFNSFGTRSALAATDITAIRALYGPRAFDKAEVNGGNASFRRATRIEVPSSFDGETPLVAWGTLATRSDVDTFSFRNLSDYSGPITIRAKSEGISLVTPRLSVYDQFGHLIGQFVGAGNGATLAFTIPQTLAGKTYYARVDAAPGATSRVGRYGLALTFDQRVEPSAITVDEVLRGPYDALEASEVADVFNDPVGNLIHEDGGSDDSEGDANELRAVPGPLGLARFAATGSIASATDVDFYRIRAPRSGPRVSLVLTLIARPVGPNGVTPQVEVLDRDGNPMAVEVLRDEAGWFAAQVQGVESGRRYFVRWSGSAAGNFAFEAAFRTKPVPLQTFVTDSTTVSAPTQYDLFAARTQLFGFVISATGPAGSALQMTIANESGQFIFDRTIPVGRTVSATTPFIVPGAYTVTFTPVGADALSFLVRGSVESDPIGPQPSNSSQAPQYQNPNTSGGYVYPGGRPSFDTFLFGKRNA